MTEPETKTETEVSDGGIRRSISGKLPRLVELHQFGVCCLRAATLVVNRQLVTPALSENSPLHAALRL